MPPVAHEQRAVFREHDFEQPAVIHVAFAGGIDPEEPQTPGEFPEMPIGDEAIPGSNLQARRCGQEIRGRRHRMNIQPHRRLHRPREKDRSRLGAVD